MSRSTEADVVFIRALAEILRESDLSEIEVEREYGEDDELKVRLSRALPAPASMPAVQVPVPQAAAPAASVSQTPTVPEAEAAEPEGLVTSPMVGTAYLAPEPGAAPFVQVGDTVSEGQTLLIIEAMKTMNQIAAPRAGRVSRIIVTDAEPVEYGAPLMILE